jgi:hypothetical protein
MLGSCQEPPSPSWHHLAWFMMAMKGWIWSSGDWVSHGGDGFCWWECDAFRGALSPSVVGVLDYRGRAVVVLTPSLALCHIGLWPEWGFNELIWELPTLGLGAPFLLVRACQGSGDREHLGFSLGPPDHPARYCVNTDKFASTWIPL